MRTADDRQLLMLWLLWLGVTLVGLTWAGWFGHFPFGFAGGTGATWASVAIGVLAGALSGLGLAIGQWLILRRAYRMSTWWIAATVAGIATMHGLGDPLGDTGQVPLMSPVFVLVTAVGGLTLGALQYPLLRARLDRAEWWIPVSTVTWALGVTAGLALAVATGLDGGLWREGHALVGAVAGVVVGATTGALLRSLRPLRAPPQTGNEALGVSRAQ